MSNIMNEYTTFHKVLDYLQYFQEQSPMLNTFGYGNLVDFGKNVSGSSVNYPFLFVVPQAIEYQENMTVYSVTMIFADILNWDLSNEKDCVSDMSWEAKRFLSYIKYGQNTLPTIYDNIDVNMPVQAIPFFERFGDHVAGVAMEVPLIVFDTLDACDYYPTPTASPVQPTPTVTPTNTATPTITPTCPVTTQYLKVTLTSCHNFSLSLWEDAGFTIADNALCDYSISGTAYGDQGTIYNGVEVITSGQHSHNFNLNPVLQPGECVSAFTVNAYATVGCPCPLILVLPTPTPSSTPTPTPTTTLTSTPTNTPTITPTATSVYVCPQMLTITSSNTSIVDIGSYARQTISSGITFSYGYLVTTGTNTGYFVLGTAPDGANYPIYSFYDGGDYNVLYRRFTSVGVNQGWWVIEQSGNPLDVGLTGGGQRNVGPNYVEVGGVRYITPGTNTGTIFPTATINVEYPNPCPSTPPLAFNITSGSTKNEACFSGYTGFVYAADLGNCGGCAPLTCWACLSTGQQLFQNAALTIPVADGYYTNNMNGTGAYGTWYIVGGYPQGGGFSGGCP